MEPELPPKKNTAPTTSLASTAPAAPEAPLSPVRAAIAARVAAKKKAAAKPPPPAGRKAQELDTEAPPRSSRPSSPARQAPYFTRQMAADRK